MTISSQPSGSPSRAPTETIEIGKFKNWEQVVQAIQSAVKDITNKEKDASVFVATVSEAEFNNNRWTAMAANIFTEMPSGFTLGVLDSLYPKYSSIDLYQNRFLASDQKNTQVVAVYRV